MARIAGVNIANHQHAEIALQAIFGIGRSRAQAICGAARSISILKSKTCQSQTWSACASKSQDLPSRATCVASLDEHKAADGLGCYRGTRHRKGLPVRGQRTRTNARTRKGPRKAR